jgi:Cdc6-like AAA superfamily ATPase
MKQKLDINYVPYRLLHRDRELRLLMEFFSFIWQSPWNMAQRVIIAGDVGTGKTVLSQRFGADITREAGKRGINLIMCMLIAANTVEASSSYYIT